MDRNKNSRSGPRQGTAVFLDSRDSNTTAALHDAPGAAASASSHVEKVEPPPAQRELFGLVVGTDERTIDCGPCSRCGSSVAIIGPGVGPHHASVRCVRDHFLKWLPKPEGAA
jgi:hypothetical protein